MNESYNRTLRQMQEMAIQLKSNPNFMSWVLTAYQEQERMSEANIIKMLNTTPAMFFRLALCKRPDSNLPKFTDEVRQLAVYTSIDPIHLATLIRHVEALDTFQTMSNSREVRTETQTVSPSIGVLVAARDRVEKHEPTTPSDGVSEEDRSESHTGNEP